MIMATPTVQGFDLARIFMNAQAIRNAQQQSGLLKARIDGLKAEREAKAAQASAAGQQAQQDALRQSQLGNLAQQFYSGDTNALANIAALDPKLAAELNDKFTQAQKRQVDIEAKRKEITAPQSSPEAIQVANALGIDVQTLLTSDDPKAVRGRNLLQKSFDAGIKGRARGSGATFNLGGLRELSSANQSRQQEKILNERVTQAQLGQIDSLINDLGGADTALNAFNQLASGAAAKVTKYAPNLVGRSTRDDISRMTELGAAVNKLTSNTIAELSGAAVSPSEEKRIMRSLPSISDPPDVFMAKMQNWKKYSQIVEEQGIKALVNGVRDGTIDLTGEPSSPGSSSGARQSTRAFRVPTAKANRMRAAQAYVKNAEAKGVPPSEIEKTVNSIFGDVVNDLVGSP